MTNVEQFTTHLRTTIRDATKLKARMQERNVKAARVKCPECNGMLHGRLVGRRNHMRFWCDGVCKRQMME
ncbi:MAG: hypothetical protein JWQ74_3567 [Marmoricola sp.]|nr:hypothetical protein [Marmoricola sp.]